MKHGWLALGEVGLALLGWAGVAWGSPQLEPDNLPVPPVPFVAPSRTVELPAIPSFQLPTSDGGLHDVRELRVRGRGLLGTELTVRGYITWIYDCAQALAKPGVPAGETQHVIDDNPELCERPKFYLGVGPHASPEVALWVVDVPRPATQRERIALSSAQLAARPEVPRLAIGDLIAVTGTFALQSPHGEQNSDGLLVYKKLEHLQPSVRSSPIPSIPPAHPPDPPIAINRRLRVVVPLQNRNDSIDDYERCNRALDDHQAGLAITACSQALKTWKGNHLAWYALGNALTTRDDWRAARDAYDQAVQLRPDAAMYQLYDGIAWYEVAVRQASGDRAGQSHQAPEMFDRARRGLSIAARVAPRLWLASYYLGRTELELDHTRSAAEALTASIQADPSQAEPYVALIGLYRAWDLEDQGLAVARQASLHVRTGNVASAWYEIGMAYGATHHETEAIAAFGRAIAAGNQARAKFQRGQIYFRAGDLANARRDLEAFLVSTDPSQAFAQQIARSLLIAIARKVGDSTYLRNGGQISPP